MPLLFFFVISIMVQFNGGNSDMNIPNIQDELIRERANDCHAQGNILDKNISSDRATSSTLGEKQFCFQQNR